MKDYRKILFNIPWGGVVRNGAPIIYLFLVLNLLGVAISLFYINPSSKTVFYGGIVVWFIISNFLVLFVGNLIDVNIGLNRAETIKDKENGSKWLVFTLLISYSVIGILCYLFVGAEFAFLNGL